jgi:hypothetical protein
MSTKYLCQCMLTFHLLVNFICTFGLVKYVTTDTSFFGLGAA